MNRFTLLFSALLFFTVACSGPEPLDDLSDATFSLLNEEGMSVSFPDDFAGKNLVIGFIYTNCPDICPLITGNLKRVQQQLGEPADFAYIGITFDPARDTPDVLKRYKNAFDLNEQFHFLTGDTTEVQKLLTRLRVRTQVSFTTTTNDGRELYFLNHSDKILIVDKKSRLRFEHGGSMAPVNVLLEDISLIK